MIDQTLPTPLPTAQAPLTESTPPQPIPVIPQAQATIPTPAVISPVTPPSASPVPPVTPQVPLPQAAPMATLPPDATEHPAPIIEQHPIQTHPEEFQKLKTKTKILKFLNIIVTAGLTIEGLKGLYESLFFVFIEYQHFEEALVAHEIEGGMINQLALKAGLLIFSTAISLFFAIQMTLNHTKMLKILHIVAGITVAVVTFAVMYYASSIDILGLG